MVLIACVLGHRSFEHRPLTRYCRTLAQLGAYWSQIYTDDRTPVIAATRPQNALQSSASQIRCLAQSCQVAGGGQSNSVVSLKSFSSPQWPAFWTLLVAAIKSHHQRSYSFNCNTLRSLFDPDLTCLYSCARLFHLNQFASFASWVEMSLQMMRSEAEYL